MCADIFTKYFTDPLAWTHAHQLLGILPRIKGIVIAGSGSKAAADSERVNSSDGGVKKANKIKKTVTIAAMPTPHVVSQPLKYENHENGGVRTPDGGVMMPFG